MAVVVNLRFFPMLLLACVSPGRADSGCAECHPKQTSSFARTAMARALLNPQGTDVFKFRDGRYQYVVSTEAPLPTYSVTDGEATISAPIVWSFGAGIAGQTWIYEYQGQLYESRVSYYSKIKGLDLTIGAAGSVPNSLEMAAGRKMSSQDVAE